MKTFLSRHRKWTASFVLAAVFAMAASAASAATAFGVNSANQLVRFNTSTPGTVTSIGAITGLQAGETILGIDFRPVNGQLYALGSTSRLYTINISTGAATQVGAAGAFSLAGTDFGFDFNPTVDRIRVVSNTGQNLRLNPDTGALAATDTPLNPGTPNVNAAAYTNNFAGAATTTLYDIDTTTNSLYTQNPPNNGTLNLVGPLGVAATSSNGFDIAPYTGQAFAALTVGGTSGLYTINLATGAATLVGAIGGGNNALRGLAIAFGSAASTVLDYDGDRRTDYSIFRLNTNTFYAARSSNNSVAIVQFGLATDVQTPGDYDGDGKTDFAVWRPENGVFYVLRSSDNQVQYYQFGLNGDEPVARDYDGDGRTDFAVVRRSAGRMIWYVNNSSNNSFRVESFGLASDITAPGDYDGDGRFDFAVFRNNADGSGTFYVQRGASYSSVQFGLGSDLVVPGDYDGDGKTDYALVRAGTQYTWFVLRSSDGGFSSVNFGTKPQYTAQGDYDGDGRTDIATWDPISGTFNVLRSSNVAFMQYRFGLNGDYPVANYDTH